MDIVVVVCMLPLRKNPMSPNQNCTVLVAQLPCFVTIVRVHSPMRSRK